MSVVNRNGKATLAITYLLKSQSLSDQVDEELKLKNEIANLFNEKGYTFILADDDYVDKKYTQIVESELPRPLTLEEIQQMAGKPIWHQSLTGKKSQWRILDTHTASRPKEYGYGVRWIAYANEVHES